MGVRVEKAERRACVLSVDFIAATAADITTFPSGIFVIHTQSCPQRTSIWVPELLVPIAQLSVLDQNILKRERLTLLDFAFSGEKRHPWTITGMRFMSLMKG